MIRATAFPRGGRRRVVVAMVLLVAAAFAIRLVRQSRESGLSSDSCQYLSIARSLAGGGGFASGGSQHPDLGRPPGYPILLAVVMLVVGNPETAATLLGALASALAVVPIALLVRDLYGVRAGIAAAVLAAVSCLVAAGGRFLPTAPFLALTLTASWLTWRGTRRARRTILLAAGAVAGVSALTRMEGIVWAPALAVWIVALAPSGPRGVDRTVRGFGKRLALASCLLAGAAGTYLPYAAWASVRMGRPTISPGLEYLRFTRLVADRLGLREIPGSSLDWSYQARIVPTADHRELVLPAFFRDGVMPSADPRFANPETGLAPGRGAGDGWDRLARRRFVIVLQNLRELPYAIRADHFAPATLLLLGAVGVARAVVGTRRRSRLLFLATLAVLSLVPVASHIEARFLFEAFAVGLIFCAVGWGYVDRRTRRLPRGGALLAAVAHLAIAGAVLAAGLAHPLGGDPRPQRMSFLRAQVGTVALPNGGMLAVQPQFPFVAGRPYRPIPLGEPEDVRAFARAQGAATLVVEGRRDLERRPSLARLATDDLPEGFRRIHTAPHPDGGDFQIFALDP